MEVENVFDRLPIYNLIQNHQAFVQWREPGSEVIRSKYCSGPELIKLDSIEKLDHYEGFIFAPFQVDDDHPIYVFPNTAGWVFDEQIKQQGLAVKKCLLSEIPILKSSTEYQQKIEYLLNILNHKKIKKAVLSRYQCFPQYNYTMMPELFNRLCGAYPNAFVYQVFIPQKGYWVGATPELLLSVAGDKATTVSLAATQPFDGDLDHVQWNKKERIEQELVSEHIRNIFTRFNISDYTEIGPEPLKAASLVHLRTFFEFKRTLIDGRFGSFLSQLHPTPAICGLPVELSRSLLKEIEGYDREYYTGFLGNISNKIDTKLFVNLRCLQAFENGVALYAGGGITADSNANNEWHETQLKIQTLQRILEELR